MPAAAPAAAAPTPTAASLPSSSSVSTFHGTCAPHLWHFEKANSFSESLNLQMTHIAVSSPSRNCSCLLMPQTHKFSPFPFPYLSPPIGSVTSNCPLRPSSFPLPSFNSFGSFLSSLPLSSSSLSPLPVSGAGGVSPRQEWAGLPKA